jgi:hypothetical protein
MAFNLGKKEGKKPSTLEEVKKAYEDLSDDDKKSFHQSIADRVHESIAAQEREHGQEDGQSAQAREHEALGAEYADGKGDADELHKQDDTPEEKREDKADEAREESSDDGIKAILARLDALEARFGKEEAEKTLEEKRQKYGLDSHIVPERRDEEFDEKRIDKLLGK